MKQKKCYQDDEKNLFRILQMTEDFDNVVRWMTRTLSPGIHAMLLLSCRIVHYLDSNVLRLTFLTKILVFKAVHPSLGTITFFFGVLTQDYALNFFTLEVLAHLVEARQ